MLSGKLLKVKNTNHFILKASTDYIHVSFGWLDLVHTKVK